MYTKVHDGTALGYRDHFTFGPNISINLKEAEEMVTIGDTLNNKYVSFTSESYESLIEFYRLIKTFYDPRKSGDSAFVDGSEINFPSTTSLHDINNKNLTDDEDWISIQEKQTSSHDCNEEEILEVANSRFYVH